MADPQAWNSSQIEKLGRLDAHCPINYYIAMPDQDRVAKAERRDGGGDLTNMGWLLTSHIPRRVHEISRRAFFDRQPRQEVVTAPHR
jgi:hypothetical protein